MRPRTTAQSSRNLCSSPEASRRERARVACTAAGKPAGGRSANAALAARSVSQIRARRCEATSAGALSAQLTGVHRSGIRAKA